MITFALFATLFAMSGLGFAVFGAKPSEGDDAFHGDDADNTFEGTAKPDMAYGGGGNDELLGRGAADTLYGGTGNDTLGGNYGDDQLYGNAGKDILGGGPGTDSLWGGDGNDTINGHDGNDYISGDLGDDRLIGEAGNDTIFGGTGHDNISGGDGDNLLNGGAGRDRISGGVDNDTIDGGEGDDSIWGNYGQDLIYAGSGNDFVFTKGQDAEVFGGAGDDRLAVTDGSAYGGEGNDILRGYSSEFAGNVLNGGAGIDTLISGTSYDIMVGGFGDAIAAGDGKDILIFTGEYDALTDSASLQGGSDADLFLIQGDARMADAPVYVDYDPAEDSLVMIIVDEDGTLTGTLNDDDMRFEATEQDIDTRIDLYLTVNGTETLVNSVVVIGRSIGEIDFENIGVILGPSSIGAADGSDIIAGVNSLPASNFTNTIVVT